MNPELSSFAAHLRGLIDQHQFLSGEQPLHQNFGSLALELFALQFKHNPAYRKICGARKLTPQVVEHWTQIPSVPTSAFKELELTSIPSAERTAVFHSSGTTEQKPSRHFHNAESLVVYEASLWPWFQANTLPDLQFTNYDLRAVVKSATGNRQPAIFLTPSPEQVPHSSLVHMFEIVRQKLGADHASFVGKFGEDGAWTLDFDATFAALNLSLATRHPSLVLGTAFSFVHLLDHLGERDLHIKLPVASRVMETGGYKNRSRVLPKVELHALITERLGVPRENIICEYGMSELSSQAYDSAIHPPSAIRHPRVFRFPPWARAQIISPETGCEVAEGETGIIRIFDLANVFSVAAVQTEDLGIRWGEGFELTGRAQLAEPRGCSLMSA